MRLGGLLLLAAAALLNDCGGGPPDPDPSQCTEFDPARGCRQCASMGNAPARCGWCTQPGPGACMPSQDGARPSDCAEGDWVFTSDDCPPIAPPDEGSAGGEASARGER